MRLDVFGIIGNPKEIVSNASEGMDLLARQEQAGNEKKLPSSMSLYRLQAEGVWYVFPSHDLD